MLKLTTCIKYTETIQNELSFKLIFGENVLVEEAQLYVEYLIQKYYGIEVEYWESEWREAKDVLILKSDIINALPIIRLDKQMHETADEKNKPHRLACKSIEEQIKSLHKTKDSKYNDTISKLWKEKREIESRLVVIPEFDYSILVDLKSQR